MPGSDGAVWSPFFGDLLKFGPRRNGFETVKLLDGTLQADVVWGKDIEPAEREHKEHLGGPDTDALYGSELGDYLVVWQLVQMVEDGGLLSEVLGQVVDVAGFAARQAESAQLIELKPIDASGVQSRGVLNAPQD